MSINDKIRNLEKDNFVTKPLNRALFLNPFMLKSKNQLYNNIANAGGFGNDETNNNDNDNDNADSLLNNIKGFLFGSPLPDSRRRSPNSRRRSSPDSRRRSSPDSRRRSPSPDPDDIQVDPDSRRRSSRRRVDPDSRRRSSRRRVDPNYRDPDSDIIPTTSPTEAEIKEYVTSVRQSDLTTQTNFIKSTTPFRSDNLETKKNELELARHVQSEVYQKPEDRRSIKGYKRIRELGNDENVIYKSESNAKKNEVIWGIRGSDTAEDWLVDFQIWAKKQDMTIFPTGLMDKRFKKANLKYNEIRNQFPNANIIMGGHSLGNAVGLEILKNNKADDNILLYGFNGYHHNDYIEKDLNKHHTVAVEGDFVSWLSDNENTVIQLLEKQETKEKLAGTVAAAFASLVSIYIVKKIAENKLIDAENLFTNEHGNELPNEIMDQMSESEMRKVLEEMDLTTHTAEIKFMDPNDPEDALTILDKFEEGDTENWTDPKNILAYTVHTQKAPSRREQLADMTTNIEAMFKYIKIIAGVSLMSIYGIFYTDLHSSDNFKPKNPKWIKKKTKKEKDENLRNAKKLNYDVKYELPDEL